MNDVLEKKISIKLAASGSVGVAVLTMLLTWFVTVAETPARVDDLVAWRTQHEMDATRKMEQLIISVQGLREEVRELSGTVKGLHGQK